MLGSSVIVKIVSFGSVGPELVKAIDNSQETSKRSLETLTKDRERVFKGRDGKQRRETILGLPLTTATQIFSHLTITLVDEDTLTNAILEKLRDTLTAGDPIQAFHNLMWWLVTSSEKQTRLDRARVVEKLDQIGRFLSFRAMHSHEWHTSIVPIAAPEKSKSAETLASEFYEGGCVRFEHITHDCDVVRDSKLKELQSAFSECNVVVVHAASGQGKTSLCYRYIHDFAPAEFRFEVHPAANVEHARRMVAAIAGHSEALDVPTLIYVDVHPGDAYWVEIVRELARHPDIRILVSIREEDFRIANVGPADFSFKPVSLDFSETEATAIFDAIDKQKPISRFFDFTDAWSQFGARKTLYEFTYFLTQDGAIADRISRQVADLKDRANAGDVSAGGLKLLKLVSVAAMYEARLDIAKLALVCDAADIAREIQRFDEEYLLRETDDGRYVEGFHSIRSSIIANELTDPVISPWSTIAQQCLPLMNEDDLEAFLMCAFSRKPESSDELVEELQEFTTETWRGVRGILRSLLWLGLHRYMEENSTVIKEANAYGFGALILDWDLAEVEPGGGVNMLAELAETLPRYAEAAALAEKFQERMTDKGCIFDIVRNWLVETRAVPSSPENADEFASFAEVAFWIGHLGIESVMTDCINDSLLDQANKILPIHLFSDFAASVQKCCAELYTDWVKKNCASLTARLRREAGFISWDNDDDVLTTWYVVDLDHGASRVRQNNEKATINSLSVERVEILSRCFPGKSRYATKGVGNTGKLVFVGVDESVKSMPPENIPKLFLPRFNALGRGIIELVQRPQTWDEYFDALTHLRTNVISVMEQCYSACKSASANRHGISDVAAWMACGKQLGLPMLLPVSAVDEWGFASETKPESDSLPTSHLFAGPTRLKRLLKAVHEYRRTTRNFLDQSYQSLMLVPPLAAADDARQREMVLKKAKELGLQPDSVRISVFNGIDACMAIQDLHSEIAIFREADVAEAAFSDRESKEFHRTILQWLQFSHPDEINLASKGNRSKGRPKKGKRKTVNAAPESISDLLRPSRNRIRQELQRLKPLGITAVIHSDSIPWEAESALWITCDTPRPLESLAAIGHVWEALRAALLPDAGKVVRPAAMNLLWEKIVVVPMVSGRSLDRHAYPFFKFAMHWDAEYLKGRQWALMPHQIPDEVWNNLCLSEWNVQNDDHLARLGFAYGNLLIHIEHLADLDRCESVDELGGEILQQYINVEVQRLSPAFQELLDSLTKSLNCFDELHSTTTSESSTTAEYRSLMLGMRDAVFPIKGYSMKASLTLEQIVDWRGRLIEGTTRLGVARMLWHTHKLGLAQ